MVWSGYETARGEAGVQTGEVGSSLVSVPKGLAYRLGG